MVTGHNKFDIIFFGPYGHGDGWSKSRVGESKS